MKILKLVILLILFAVSAHGFEFRRSTERIEEVGTVVVCVLEDARGSYVFRPPFNWEASFDEQSRVVTLAPKKDAKSWITLRIAASTNSPGAGVRAYAQSAFPGAQIEEQFTMHTASQEAKAVDFRDASAGTIPLKRRLALVGSPSGTFEFLLSSRPDHFTPGEQSFNQMLGSFEFRGPPAKANTAGAGN